MTLKTHFATTTLAALMAFASPTFAQSDSGLKTGTACCAHEACGCQGSCKEERHPDCTCQDCETCPACQSDSKTQNAKCSCQAEDSKSDK